MNWKFSIKKEDKLATLIRTNFVNTSYAYNLADAAEKKMDGKGGICI